MNRAAIEHPLQDASTDTTTTAAAGPRNPFIWDPRRNNRKSAKLKPSLVQNETTEVFVTLQNPFLFDLEIPNIELRCGVTLTSDHEAGLTRLREIVPRECHSQQTLSRQ